MSSVLEGLDWWVLGLYFSAFLSVAIWISVKKNNKLSDYFLAGRNVGWFVIGMSIFATNISASHMIGLAGIGAESGMPMAHFEVHSLMVLVLGWVFLPFYLRGKVLTMPHFLAKRFDSRSRWVLSGFSVIWYVAAKVSMTMYAGGVVVSELMGWPFWYGALGIVVITGLYTAIGGLKAVMYTETVQGVVLICGAVAITYLGLQEVGGWEVLKTTVGPEHFNMWRPMSDPDFPWTGMLFGGFVLGIWYWSTEMYIVQRVLAAKDLKIGRRGTILAGYLKLLPVFIFILPGIIAFALAKQGVLTYNTPNEVFPALMNAVLPAGIKGLVAAGLLAALMSSLASVFISCSTIFTIDIYEKIVPYTKEIDLVKSGKWVTFVVALLGIIWIPFMEMVGKGVFYGNLLTIQAYFAPSISAVFLLGILWKRVNAVGALVTLIGGLIMGVAKVVAQINQDALSGFLEAFARFNFAHMILILFIISVVLCIGVSLATAKPDYAAIQGLSYGTLTKEDKEQTKQSITAVDCILSLVLVGIVVGILYFFST